jgi:hypothetical protein
MISFPSRLLMHVEMGIGQDDETRDKPREEDGRKALAGDTVFDLQFDTPAEREEFWSRLIELRKDMARRLAEQDEREADAQQAQGAAIVLASVGASTASLMSNHGAGSVERSPRRLSTHSAHGLTPLRSFKRIY